MSALGVRLDPIPAFNFVVQLIEAGGFAPRSVAGFSECSGLESSMAVDEYLEGGVNDRVHKFPGRFSFANVTLKRGVTLDPQLRLWHDAVLRGEPARRDGLIVLLDEGRLPVIAWKFERGLPVKWVGPACNAMSSEPSIETLEIAVEKLEQFEAVSSGG
jgi:phage tail-like protein